MKQPFDHSVSVFQLVCLLASPSSLPNSVNYGPVRQRTCQFVRQITFLHVGGEHQEAEKEMKIG